MNYSLAGKKKIHWVFGGIFFGDFFLGYGVNYKQSYISKPKNHKPVLKTYKQC